MGDETSDPRGISVAVNSVDSGNRAICENSSHSVNQNVSETVIVIRSEEVESACVSDENGNSNSQCHDPSLETPIPSPPATTTDAASGLIQLGCRCKDELGIVHAHCAEAWFKLKGNR
ncbi:hypothetical protein Acr_00g0101070 [Actinidia rufa]|uniref:RING-CH-type domain-containing protein n=1 Tax=Actinidia rufa TaxID=165716 RepID=A0A7J0E0N7_9ERIC|nr:hypothetical protein Acr_00g0101070 [Actinidia rufa]